MKTALFLCVLAALSLAWFHQSELATVRAELLAAREKIVVTERQRVPKEELVKAQAAVAATEEKMAGLEEELEGTREQLVASQASARAAQRHLSMLRDNTPETGASPGLVKGTYALMDDTLVYSADAQLKVGKSVLISSPTGLMLSDREVATVAGDLAVETPSGTMQATHAFIDVNGGKIEMTADSMSFTNK